MPIFKNQREGVMERIFGYNENEMKTRMKPFACVVLLLAVVLSSAFIGAGRSLILGTAATVTSIMILAFSRSRLCMIFMAVPAVIIWLYIGNIYIPMLFCAFITAIGTGSFLLKTIRSPFLIALIPTSYLLALLAGGSPLSALLSLSVFPAIAVMAAVTDGKRERIGVICRVSTAIFITGALAALVYVAVAERSLYPSAIFSSLDRVFDKMEKYYAAEYAALSPNYIAMGMTPPTADDARLYAIAVYGQLPAFAIIVINIVSFISYHLSVSLLEASGQKKYINRKSLAFKMSFSSVLVFIIAYFVMLATSYSGNDTVSLVAENIYMILLPGLVFTGILVLLGRREGGRRHLFWLIVIILLFFNSPNSALLIVAFIGCSVIISAALSSLFYGKWEN